MNPIFCDTQINIWKFILIVLYWLNDFVSDGPYTDGHTLLFIDCAISAHREVNLFISTLVYFVTKATKNFQTFYKQHHNTPCFSNSFLPWVQTVFKISWWMNHSLHYEICAMQDDYYESDQFFIIFVDLFKIICINPFQNHRHFNFGPFRFSSHR